MRVSGFEQTVVDGWLRTRADLVAEDRDTPNRSLWVDFRGEVASDVELSPDSFLATAVIQAMHRGERRVLVEGRVCARHIEEMRTVAAILARWIPGLVPPLIETTGGVWASSPRGERAGVCFSGGVDSLAAIRENRRSVSRQHADSFRDGLLYFGLNTYDFDGEAPSPGRLSAFDEHCRRLDTFGAALGMSLLPMRTNVRTLYASWDEWHRSGQAAALAAGAHSLSSRLRSLTIAAAGIGITSLVHGTHPLLDPHFSSFALDVRTVQATMSRLDKVAAIAEWPEALAVLRVCLMFDVPNGAPNCGRCEKCVRTMLELMLCGALDRATSFPVRDVTAEMVRDVPVNETNLFYLAYRDRLASIGRVDLARAIDDRLTAADRATRPRSLLARLRR